MNWWMRFVAWFKGSEETVTADEPALISGSRIHEASLEDTKDDTGQWARERVGEPAAQSLAMPYDESLLDRVRMQWQMGEFATIAALTHTEVSAHPSRGVLAAYVGASCEQQGQTDAARQWYHRARDWGCPQRKLAEIMLSNLHSTFASVKVMLGDESGAREQLEEMAAIGFAGGQSERLLGIRLESMKSEHAMPLLSSPAHARPVGTSAPAAMGHAAASDANQPAADTVDLGKMLSESVSRLSDQLKKSVTDLRAEVANATRQMESHSELQAFLRDEATMPALHGWPVSPDIAALLLRQIERQTFSAVIEFGSGSSTFLMGTALLRAAKPGMTTTPLLSFDHLSSYAQATRDLIAKLQPGDHVRVEHAPLVPRKGSDGLDYLYYDCASALKTLANRVAVAASDAPLLVFVDGPPGATGIHARFPTLDCVLDAFPRHPLLLVLDDYVRPEEKAVAEKWKKRLDALGRKWSAQVVKLEKDAVLIEIEGASDVA